MPNGIIFNTGTRLLSGTPTVVGTGTITVTATNSQGTDTWTVDYEITAVAATPNLEFEFSTITINEGGTGTISVRLTSQPTIQAIVTHAITGDISITPTQRGFNTTNWGTYKTFTVTGLEDTDMLDDTASVVFTATGGSTDTGTVTVNITDDDVLVNVAPNFADGTGDAQNWTQNTAISNITVPAATGTPTPTYAASDLPAGVSFNTVTRLLSGTPTAVSSGTITITATNSAGSDTWTVDYTTTAEASDIPIPTGLTALPTTILVDSTTDSYFVTFEYDDNAAFSSPSAAYDTFESTFHSSSWTPPSGTTYIRARFTTAVNDGGMQGPWSSTITYGTTLAAPNFADDAGDAQSWTQNTSISNITVPAATGNPAPAYSASGLPSGVSFSTSTRVLSGTPTSTGSGTITITATNSQGSDTWTMTYSIAAEVVLQAPGLPSTPTLSSRTTTSLTLATVAGSGGAPTLYRWRYSVNATVSNADPFVTSTTPSVTITGLNVNTDYWIDVRAQNSAGNSGYTADLATSTLDEPVTLTAPNFADGTGDAQAWTQNVAITSITVPQATGNPTPAYTVIGNLPNGISFNATTRVLSGTPTVIASGTIRIRATNSEGSDDWTVAHTTTAQPIAPNWTDDMGDDQSWTQNIAITSFTVPAATGTPAHLPILLLTYQTALRSTQAQG